MSTNNTTTITTKKTTITTIEPSNIPISTIENVNSKREENELNVYHHQQRPYFGMNGSAYELRKQNILYKNQNNEPLNWNCFQRRRLETQMQRSFPKIFILVHSLSLLLLSIILIALQIALLATNGALAFVASGIWGGVYFVVTALLTFLLVYRRSYCLYLTTYFLHAFGILMAIGAFLIVNIIAISEYVEFCSYYPNCFNPRVKVLNYISFFLGVVCIIMLIFYLIFMPCYILDVYHGYREQKKQKQTKPNEILKHSIVYSQEDINYPDRW